VSKRYPGFSEEAHAKWEAAFLKWAVDAKQVRDELFRVYQKPPKLLTQAQKAVEEIKATGEAFGYSMPEVDAPPKAAAVKRWLGVEGHEKIAALLVPIIHEVLYLLVAAEKAYGKSSDQRKKVMKLDNCLGKVRTILDDLLAGETSLDRWNLLDLSHLYYPGKQALKASGSSES